MAWNSWVSGLNPEQKQAVLHNYGPLLILAGAGSGKTTVLVARTGRLIDDKIVRPEEIVVLTFTNKAARELKERVSHKLGKLGKKIWAGTFHSFGLSMLKKHYKKAGLPKNFGIVDSGDCKAIIREIIKEIRHDSQDSFDVEKVLNIVNKWRESGNHQGNPEDPYEQIAEMVMPRYVKKLELLGVVDFDGLLLKPIEILENYPEVAQDYQHRIQQLMVDEFQDTNNLQMRLVSKLVEGHNNISVVGDDDQAIYGWRGAQVSNILGFPKKFAGCEVVRLVRNYRSTKSILDVANALIENNRHRHDKTLQAGLENKNEVKPEIFVYETDDEEVEELIGQIKYFQTQGFDYKDIAVLYRSNSQGGMLEGHLRYHKIPYLLTGGSAFFDRKEVKDVLAYIRCCLSPNEVAVRRILHSPPRGIGEKTIKRIEHVAHEKDISFFKTLVNIKDIPEIAAAHIRSAQDLVNQLDELKNQLIHSATDSCGDVLLKFLSHIGYRDYVYGNYKDATAGGKRWILIDILARVLNSFIEKGGRKEKTLRDFIDSMELRDQIDSAVEGNQNKIQLMTLHACKGLEFPVTIIIGVEEDMIPHKTLGSDIDEERRLFYVGVTRAKRRLVLTRARKRKRYGKLRPVSPSRFLFEFPEKLVTVFEEGHRPLAEADRQQMMKDLFAKIEQKKINTPL